MDRIIENRNGLLEWKEASRKMLSIGSNKPKMLKILSLGYGVQSFTLAAMSALGEIEKIDRAIHADTRHEREGTYRFMQDTIMWLESHGVRVTLISAGNTDPIRKSGSIEIPAYFTGEKIARMRRQCTRRWKIGPIKRCIRMLYGKRKTEMWLGISTDEALRMKPSRTKYITNRWPLIEMGMSRDDCVQWLKDHDLPVPPKSTCVFCPYHDKKLWLEMKREGGKDWEEAVSLDRKLRERGLALHQSGKPIEDVELFGPDDYDHFVDECLGICGM